MTEPQYSFCWESWAELIILVRLTFNPEFPIPFFMTNILKLNIQLNAFSVKMQVVVEESQMYMSQYKSLFPIPVQQHAPYTRVNITIWTFCWLYTVLTTIWTQLP